MTILKIEKYGKEIQLCIYRVDGIKMYDPNAPSGYTDFIEHMPFSEKAISKSVTKLVGKNDNLPDFSEGYNEWEKASDNGKGDYWTIELKEAIGSAYMPCMCP